VPARIFEGIAHDLLAAGARDQLDARSDFRRQLILNAGVQILFVLAHDHDVHIRVLGVDERVIGDAWPHIRVLAQRLARGHIEALESAALRRGDGRFEKDFGAQERIPRTRFYAGGVAAQVNLLANLNGLDLESRASRFQDLKRGIHDFGTDAIAVGNSNRSFSGHKRKLQHSSIATPMQPNTTRPGLT